MDGADLEPPPIPVKPELSTLVWHSVATKSGDQSSGPNATALRGRPVIRNAVNSGNLTAAEVQRARPIFDRVVSKTKTDH